MSTQTKKREKLWHSDVRSEKDGIAVKLSSDVKDGKYGPYCFVSIYGEDEDRLFSLDSTKARREYERVRELVGEDTWVIMEAAGAKEAATLFFKDKNGNPILDGEGTQDDAPFPPKQMSGPETPQEPVGEAPEEMDTSLYLDCLNAAAEAVKRFHTLHDRSPSEMEMRVATTLYINRS